MNVHIVYAHHEPTSFTAALKNTSLLVLEQAGHTVTVSDLYGQGFQPLAEKIDFQTTSSEHFNYMEEQGKAVANSGSFSPDIVEEMQKITAAELLIFHFPIWWLSAPAALKGWFDRVLARGFAYDSHGQIYEHGLLRGKKVLIVATASDPADFFQKEGRHKATMNEILHPILHGTFARSGMDVFEPYVVYDILSKSDQERAGIIEMFREFILAAPENQNFYSQYENTGGGNA